LANNFEDSLTGIGFGHDQDVRRGTTPVATAGRANCDETEPIAEIFNAVSKTPNLLKWKFIYHDERLPLTAREVLKKLVVEPCVAWNIKNAFQVALSSASLQDSSGFAYA
jgi:hypothetical protein